VTRVATELAAEHFDLGSLDTSVLRRGLLEPPVRFLLTSHRVHAVKTPKNHMEDSVMQCNT
jgi:hypothetical protein